MSPIVRTVDRVQKFFSKEIAMKNRSTLLRVPARWKAGLLALALLVAGLAAPAKSYAVTSGPGVWDLMIFGNYDLVSPNTGNAYSSIPAPLTSPTWANTMQNGYGAGIGTAYWFNDVLALRVMAQGNFYQLKSPATGSMESAPLTGGLEAKLYGGPDYYLYAVVDAGAAYELDLPNNTSPTLSGKGSTSAWSAYGDVGLGVNIDWVFVEVKLAYLPDSIPHSTSSQNALWYIPVTAGFNF